MAKLVWHESGTRKYETGVDHVVLFVDGQTAVAWDGVASISENPTGAEPNDIFADNIKYLSLTSVEEFEASIEAYYRPDKFLECDGFAVPLAGFVIGQQPRKKFGLYYRTQVLNENSTVPMYKHHFIWNATAGVSDRAYETVNDSPEPISFSWDITTIPKEEVITGTAYAGTYSTAYMCIDESLAASDANRASIRNKVVALVEDDTKQMPTIAQVVAAGIA